MKKRVFENYQQSRQVNESFQNLDITLSTQRIKMMPVLPPSNKGQSSSHFGSLNNTKQGADETISRADSSRDESMDSVNELKQQQQASNLPFNKDTFKKMFKTSQQFETKRKLLKMAAPNP